MAAKLGRYIFRRIAGRIVPIRIGREAATEAALAAGKPAASQSALKKLNLLAKQMGVGIGRKGKLKGPVKDFGSGHELQRFMEKTGMVRFSKGKSSETFADMAKAPTYAQRKLLDELDEPILFEFSHKGTMFTQAQGVLRDPQVRQHLGKLPIYKPTKTGASIAEKAKKQMGLTYNPYEAGFISREGEMLDFSGKKFGGRGGVRELDHREIAGLVPTERVKMSDKKIREFLRKAQLQRKQNTRMDLYYRTKKK